MKFNGVFSAAIVLAALSSSALAKPLQEAEQKFLTEVIQAGAIAQHCPGFAFVEKSTIRLGDRYGVDGQALTDAITEATRLLKMESYDRRKIIPEVTQQVERFGGGLARLFKSDPKVCNTASETGLHLGLLRK